jgi:hypothetical protein
MSYTHFATCSPFRFGRVLPRMMPILVMIVRTSVV